MRLTCMFSFILLFGAAGLVVFIHLQDPEEIVHQQTPGTPNENILKDQSTKWIMYLAGTFVQKLKMQQRGKQLVPLQTLLAFLHYHKLSKATVTNTEK